MALYREPYTDSKGRKRRSKKWTYEHYVNGERERIRLGVSDRRAAEEMVRDLKVKADRAKAGYTDPFEEQLRRPIDEHVTDFETHLQAKAVTKKHLNERMDLLRAFVKADRPRTVTDLDCARGEAWLLAVEGAQNKHGADSARSFNKRRTTLRHFGRWLLENKRIPHDPFPKLPRRNEAADRQHDRRPLSTGGLTPDVKPGEGELDRLIGPSTPIQRALLYRFAATTGLRENECRQALVSDLDLRDPAAASVTVAAYVAKNRKDADVPIPPTTASLLKVWLEARGAKSDELVFAEITAKGEVHKRGRSCVPYGATFEADLTAAKIKRMTDEGVIDFHALRTTYATNLVLAGTMPAELVRLMRVSSVELVMRYYAKIRLRDLHGTSRRIDPVATEVTNVGTAA